ncbi:hypothetical protein [Mycolicibacterium monacense]|uniref:Uncharacterized protein n=1 Tax=Mycolicibacterium monacense TaxID=85693 RepID=A0AAD1IRI7_MYCMB|nr:hypothetical protein [Mycolicibacterium monacense]MDA4104752.1 hypothetical protein [Mycolicibacterium monacense DSM 44395]BBZ59178.1 hypothetical protein MMON_04790 [Mycolicibacterium monacense]
MSGFDTSQPIADEKSLKDIDPADTRGAAPAGDPESAESDQLGDATPGPR